MRLWKKSAKLPENRCFAGCGKDFYHSLAFVYMQEILDKAGYT